MKIVGLKIAIFTKLRAASFTGNLFHDDVTKWKHFPRYWQFVRGIHRSPVNSPHKGQWRGALMFTLICARINGWVNNRKAGDLRRNHAHYDVSVMDNPKVSLFDFIIVMVIIIIIITIVIIIIIGLIIITIIIIIIIFVIIIIVVLLLIWLLS